MFIDSGGWWSRGRHVLRKNHLGFGRTCYRKTTICERTSMVLGLGWRFSLGRILWSMEQRESGHRQTYPAFVVWNAPERSNFKTPEIGVPPSSISRWDFPWNRPSSYGGTPIFRNPPNRYGIFAGTSVYQPASFDHFLKKLVSFSMLTFCFAIKRMETHKLEKITWKLAVNINHIINPCENPVSISFLSRQSSRKPTAEFQRSGYIWSHPTERSPSFSSGITSLQVLTDHDC